MENEHLSVVEKQFTRRAEAYSQMEVVRSAQIFEYAIAITQVQKTDRVLDVACGPGFLTIAFAKYAAAVVGVDVTGRFLESARAEASREGLANVSFIRADVENLMFPAGTFDIAVCKFAFHHFRSPDNVLAEMKGVTRRTGRILIMDMITSEDPARSEYHNRIERLCDPSHVKALSESEFEKMFKRIGLEVRLKQGRQTSYSVKDWMRHGGPSPEAAEQIMELMRLSLVEDRSGLNVRLEGDELSFSHTGISYLLQQA